MPTQDDVLLSATSVANMIYPGEGLSVDAGIARIRRLAKKGLLRPHPDFQRRTRYRRSDVLEFISKGKNDA